MNDLTYEFQRMVNRSAEIQTEIEANGAQAAWEKYSRAHGIDHIRFKGDLSKLRARFSEIGRHSSSV